jgi:hypothetical protein
MGQGSTDSLGKGACPAEPGLLGLPEHWHVPPHADLANPSLSDEASRRTDQHERRDE